MAKVQRVDTKEFKEEAVKLRQRRHSSLGYLSPLAFEQQWEVPAENPAVFLPD